MIKWWQCCAFFMLCIIIELNLISGRHHNHINAHHGKYHVDYFVLAMEWPQGTCEYVNATHRHKCVVSDEVKGWVLHGLWPSIKGHHFLQYCNRSAKFDYDKVKSLEGDLMQYWPNLYADSSKMFLWKHEYEKHGTCAALVEGFETELEYFRKAMDLLHKYAPMPKLQSKDISPRVEAYESERIMSAVDFVYGAGACTQCSYYGGGSNEVRVLSGLEICLTKELELMECPHCGRKYHCTGEVFYHPLHFTG